MKPTPSFVLATLLLAANPLSAQVPATPVGGQEMSTAARSAALASGTVTEMGPDAQSPFMGGVPTGEVRPGKIGLSLEQALDRALKYNLAVVVSGQDARSARGARLKALADLRPNLTTQTAETRETLDLAAFGFSGLPGFPTFVGPFSVFNARAFLSQSIFDSHTLHNAKAAAEDVKAAELASRDARELVVLVTEDLYLQAVAFESRVETARAQVKAAEAVFNRAADMKKAGVIPAIDLLRSEVELRAQQQRLIAAENDVQKARLNLARAIGLPLRQEFELTDKIPYSPFSGMTFDEALAAAYRSRADYQRAERLVGSAEYAKKAAQGEALPSLEFNGDYGDIGRVPGQSHGTYTVAASLRIPIFQGGRVHGEVLAADALLKRRRAELADLGSRLEYQVRTAFLDLKASGEQVQVARKAVNLADEQLRQAEDRFSAGVVNSVEVVLAQEADATANENYISSLFAFNLAKAELARAMGVAESAAKTYLGGTR